MNINCSQNQNALTCGQQPACVWLQATNITAATCQCNTVTAYGTDMACNYCNGSENLIPGNTACLCRNGFGQVPNTQTCQQCNSTSYQKFNSSDTALGQCQECVGINMVPTTAQDQCICDPTKNLISIDGTTCVCKNGYHVVDTVNNICARDASETSLLISISLIFVILSAIVALVLALRYSKKKGQYSELLEQSQNIL